MVKKHKINFVVTDLDDTLWDWLKMWYNSFHPYLQRISKEFEIDIKELKQSFKILHQKYHTTEASPFIEDLPGLSLEQKNLIRQSSNGAKSILHEFNSNKKNNLFLYKGVYDTLISIKNSGAKIVGYTESNSFFTKYRIKHLDLDGILDRVYAPKDTGVPIEMVKHYGSDFWEPKITQFRYLPEHFKKPDIEILNTIFKDFDASKTEAIYIGDKLDRDIYMAQQAGVFSVYAKYGHNIENSQYDLLREVTHWSNEDVEREKKFKANFHTIPKPNLVLENSYSELLEYFEFSIFKNANIG